MGSDFYYVPDSPFKPINLARADELEKLISVAVDCGFEKNTELFDKISVMVYGETNKAEKFTQSISEIMSFYMKSLIDLVAADKNKESPAKPIE